MDVTSKKFQDQLKREVAKITGEPKDTIKKEAKPTKPKKEDTQESPEVSNILETLTNDQKYKILSALEYQRGRVMEIHFAKAKFIEHEDQIDFWAGNAKDLFNELNSIIEIIDKSIK